MSEQPQSSSLTKLSPLVFALIFWGIVCARQMNQSAKQAASPAPPAPAAASNAEAAADTHAAPAPPAVKNVIFMIGDGMGVQQVSQAVLFRQLRKPEDPELSMEKLLKGGHSGLMRTSSYGDIVTDSAAAATAMACGQKVLNESVGLDVNGYPCETVLEKAAKLGKATGLVSTTRITHATPGSFAGHQVFRDMENEIAVDMIEQHDIDVLLSGGVANLIPQYSDEAAKVPMKVSDVPECAKLDASIDGKSKREDQKNLLATAAGKGMVFICKAEQLEQLNVGENTKVLGLFSASVFPMIQERRQIASLPSLAALTQKSLDILDKKKNGFFLMVEGGLIDYAGHDNDSGTMLQETLDFDAAIGVAVAYVQQHPDTLLIVTADHETGGFGFAYGKSPGIEMTLQSGVKYHKPYDFAAFDKFDYLINQKKSFRAMLEPITKKLYPKEVEPLAPPYTMDTAVKDLLAAVKENTSYELSPEQAQAILSRKPGAKDAEPEDFPEFYVHSSIHPDLMGREVAAQNHSVWAAGTHTSTPVLVMAQGPEPYSSRVRGFIDNTDIAKLIDDAFNNR
ncbi:MAG: alkaline phosphatase [bacterium]